VLAATIMKIPVLTISFLIVTLSLSGQIPNDTIVSIKYIDSLKRELASLKEKNNFLYWHYQEKVSVTKIDTLFICADSSIVTFLLQDGMPLKRQFNILDKDSSIVQYSIHYYNNKQHVRYIENWEALKDDNFDAKLSSAERIEYDSTGRQTLSVTYLQSTRRTVRRTFWYDQNGAKQSRVDVIKNYALWNE
jgi:hypothetical protein